jgi:hypothetical protein
MKRNAKHIAVLFETMIFFSLLIFVTNCSHASPDILTDSDVERYGLAFLRNYNETLEDNFRPAYRKYFSFYANYPYRLNATISTSKGAALEFTPSKEGGFESRAIDYRIDLGIFMDVDLNITSLDAQNATVLIYTGPPGSIFLLEAFATVVFSNMIIITNKGHLAELNEGSLLILSNVRVNERVYHLMIARGSNVPSAWTDEQAEKDAKEIFNIDLYRAFNQSEEVREYLAYPELSELVGQIVWRYQHAKETGYDLIAFRDDLARIRDLARDKYHVRTEFVDEILTYLQGINTPAPPPFWEVAPWSWVLSGIISAAIGAICVRLWSNFKGKRKRVSRRSMRKNIGNRRLASTRRGSC